MRRPRATQPQRTTQPQWYRVVRVTGLLFAASIMVLGPAAVQTACGGTVSKHDAGLQIDVSTNDAAEHIDASPILPDARTDHGQNPPPVDGAVDSSSPDGSCAPTVTCASLGWECGNSADDCGHMLDCGTCPSGSLCVQGTCSTTVTCVPNSAFCLDAVTVARCNEAGNGISNSWTCPGSTTCEDGGCVGPIAWHLGRTLDMQYVQAHLLNGGMSTLSQCTNTADDLAHSRLLCDIRRSVSYLQARFALFYGNTWTAFQRNTNDPCRANLDAWKGCIRDGLRAFVQELHAASAGMMVACSLAEYVHENNVPPGDFPAICAAGTVGRWGPNTCIPDAAGSVIARNYFIDWGTLFLDAGCRAILFQQARLTFGGDPSSSRLSASGAAALETVLTALRAHANSMGARFYVGLQAAGGAIHNGVELADFVMGAQHLETVSGFLLQPLCRNGPFISSHYGDGDWHDANLLNDAAGLPVILDYDNYSNDPNVPDDIRLLAALPDNDSRARVFLDHWRHLHNYNPNAFLSLPLSKTLGNATGVTCYGMNQWQFSASKCGLLDAAREVFDHPDVQVTVPSGQAPPIRRIYWGKQLLGRDEIVSWLYRTYLERLPSATEYQVGLDSLPALVDGSSAARCDLAWNLVSSNEYANLADSDRAFVTKTYRAFLLREPDQDGLNFYVDQLINANKTRHQVIDEVCQSQEALGLYTHP